MAIYDRVHTYPESEDFSTAGDEAAHSPTQSPSHPWLGASLEKCGFLDIKDNSNGLSIGAGFAFAEDNASMAIDRNWPSRRCHCYCRLPLQLNSVYRESNYNGALQREWKAISELSAKLEDYALKMNDFLNLNSMSWTSQSHEVAKKEFGYLGALHFKEEGSVSLTPRLLATGGDSDPGHLDDGMTIQLKHEQKTAVKHVRDMNYKSRQVVFGSSPLEESFEALFADIVDCSAS
jgi:hypothetical protein